MNSPRPQRRATRLILAVAFFAAPRWCFGSPLSAITPRLALHPRHRDGPAGQLAASTASATVLRSAAYRPHRIHRARIPDPRRRGISRLRQLHIRLRDRHHAAAGCVGVLYTIWLIMHVAPKGLRRPQPTSPAPSGPSPSRCSGSPPSSGRPASPPVPSYGMIVLALRCRRQPSSGECGAPGGFWALVSAHESCPAALAGRHHGMDWRTRRGASRARRRSSACSRCCSSFRHGPSATPTAFTHSFPCAAPSALSCGWATGPAALASSTSRSSPVQPAGAGQLHR